MRKGSFCGGRGQGIQSCDYVHCQVYFYLIIALQFRIWSFPFLIGQVKSKSDEQTSSFMGAAGHLLLVGGAKN